MSVFDNSLAAAVTKGATAVPSNAAPAAIADWRDYFHGRYRHHLWRHGFPGPDSPGRHRGQQRHYPGRIHQYPPPGTRAGYLPGGLGSAAHPASSHPNDQSDHHHRPAAHCPGLG